MLDLFEWFFSKFVPMVSGPRCRSFLAGLKNALFSAFGFLGAAAAFVGLWALLWL